MSVRIGLEMSRYAANYSMLCTDSSPEASKHMAANGALLKSDWSAVERTAGRVYVSSQVETDNLSLGTRVDLKYDGLHVLRDFPHLGIPLIDIGRIDDVRVYSAGARRADLRRSHGTPFVFVNNVLWVPPMVYSQSMVYSQYRTVVMACNLTLTCEPCTWLEHARNSQDAYKGHAGAADDRPG